MRRAVSSLLLVALLLPLAGCRNQPARIEGRVALANRDDATDVRVVLRGSTQTFITRADGLFRFTGLQPGAYDVVLRKSGYQEQVVNAITLTAGETKTLPLATLQPLANRPAATVGLEGAVSLVGSADNSNVRVSLAGHDDVIITATDGTYAFFELPPGTYTVSARRQGYTTATQADVAIATGEVAHLPVLKLRPTNLLPDEAGDETRRATLHGRVLCSGRINCDKVNITLPQWELTTTTGDDGAFTLENVPYGSWELTAALEGYESSTRSITVSTDTVRLQPIVLRHPAREAPGGSIEGQVLLPGVDNHAETTVYLPDTPFETETDAEGRFTFSDVPPGAYQLVVLHEGFEAEDVFGVTVRSYETTRVPTITLALQGADSEPATLVGTVLVEGGNDPSGVMVAIAGTGMLALSDAQGKYALEDIPPGVYTVQAHKSGYDTAAFTGIELAPGQQRALPPLVLSPTVDRPTVVFTRPADGTDDVVVDEYIDVQLGFSQEMAPRSVRDQLQITPPVTWGPAGSGSDSDGGRVLTFRLKRTGNHPLQLDTRYRVTVGADAANRDGVTLGEPYTFSFSTGGPMILRVFPPDGADDVFFSVDDYIRIETNVKVDLEEWEDEIDIRGARGQVVRLYRSPKRFGDRIMLNTTIPNPGKRFTVTVRSGVRTADGDRFDNVPYRWSFNTRDIMVNPLGRDTDNDRYLYEEDEDNEFDRNTRKSPRGFRDY